MPQYSGESVVTFSKPSSTFARSVISFANLKIFSSLVIAIFLPPVSFYQKILLIPPYNNTFI